MTEAVLRTTTAKTLQSCGGSSPLDRCQTLSKTPPRTKVTNTPGRPAYQPPPGYKTGKNAHWGSKASGRRKGG